MKERKRRGNSRYYVYFVLSLLLVLGVGIGIWYSMRHLPFFEVNKVTLSGNSAIPDSLILRNTNKYLGMNLFSVPTQHVRSDIVKLSRVKSVSVRKQLLGTLRIKVTERQPLLYIKSFEGNLYPVDSDAIVLAKYDKVYGEDLPIFSSYLNDDQFKAGLPLNKPGVSRVLALHQRVLKEAADFAPIISEYYLIDNTINIVDARYGTRLIPCEDDLARQFKRYQFVQDNGNISRRSVVDLRFENQVVVKAGDK